MTPVSSLPNLGPAVEAACTSAGIPSAEALRCLGSDAAYLRLLQSGTRPHFIGHSALVMSLQGRPWNDCHGAEKTALRARFDTLKAAVSPPVPDGDSAFEAILDDLGVVAPKPPTD